MKRIIEVAKAMDEDTDNKETSNQRRIQNVIQYIKDNQMVFQF